MRRATLIYNPVAGRQPRKREQQIREAAAALQAQGITLQLVPTPGPNTAGNLAREAVARGEDLVLVSGGDGTINEVINGLARTNAVLGILPGGTANIFAKELGLPHHPVRAALELGQWSPRRIALGCARWPAKTDGEQQQRYFLSLAGIGFDAYVIHKLTWEFKKGWGVAAYVWEAIRQALRYSYPPFLCHVDGHELRVTFALALRTKRYAGWLHLAPRADVFQPQFNLCVFRSRHWLRYFLYAAAVVLRQHLHLPDVEMVPAQKIACAPEFTGQKIYFELDGELVGELPATFEIVPDALTILVPPHKANGKQ